MMVAGRLYVMGWGDTQLPRPSGNLMGTEMVYCLDALTGETLWTRSYQGRF